jgi:hypothetical protein
LGPRSIARPGMSNINPGGARQGMFECFKCSTALMLHLMDVLFALIDAIVGFPSI